MKEKVTTVSGYMKAMTDEIRSMRETIDSQHQDLLDLSRNLERVRHELRKSNETVERQNGTIKELQERLAKYEDSDPDKNSSNSSTPPTKEKMKDEVIRRTKTLRKPSGLKPGGQPGHDPHIRKLILDPDVIEKCSCQYCKNCGKDISDMKGRLVLTTQEIDLPKDIKPTVTERRYYEKVCTCGCCNRSYAPKKGGNPVTFGKNIRALITYLNIVQCIPYERLQSLMAEVFGVCLSQGTIKNIIDDMMERSKPAIEMLTEMLKGQRIVGFDESGCYRDKNLDWAWIAQTAYLTLCFRASGRAAKELGSRFAGSLEKIIAVTDRHSAYFAINFLNHQICMAHILRELQYLSELDTGQEWSTKMQKLIREAIHERNEKPEEIIDAKPWLGRLDELLKIDLSKMKEGFEKLRKGLIKCRDYIFNFLEDPAIPSDNNASERGIRKLKVKQKISGCFRSESGADAFFAIHSIADTAWKNNQSQLNAIATLLSL